MIAYNLMAIFRLFILKSEVQHTLSTLRFKVFSIGACFQKINGEYHLKIALSKKDENGLRHYGTMEITLLRLLDFLMLNLGLLNLMNRNFNIYRNEIFPNEPETMKCGY